MTQAQSNVCSRPARLLRLTARTTLLVLGFSALPSARLAAANEFTLQTEGAGAFWADDPQSLRFTPGFYGAVRPGISLNPVVGLQWSYEFLAAPAATGFTENGTAHFLTAGVRVRPLGMVQPEEDQFGGLYGDFNLGFARTGPLNRFGFDAGLGYGLQLTPTFAIGPVVRYVQIVQPDDIAGYDPNDAQFFTAGLNLSFGPAHRVAEVVPPLVCPDIPPPLPPPPVPVCVQVELPPPPPPVETQIQVVLVPIECPDRDGDNICDVEDRCPMQAGPKETWGCPIDPCNGAPLDVLVQFQYNSTELPRQQDGRTQTMDPVLDAVAAAIAQDSTCRVCIVGYASDEGAADYNLNLSRGRATAVQGYMSARGLANGQIPSAGLGEMCQIVPTASRELNRRVGFMRLQDGESCPTTCPQ